MSKNISPGSSNQTTIACIWDFDKTLIPGYMQAPLFQQYGIDCKSFWEEVNKLPEIYQQRGIAISQDTVYLNHMLSYVKNGPLKGLSNAKLEALGKELVFYSGLPDFFKELQQLVQSKSEYQVHGITLEHYIISTGLAAMIRGSEIAPYVENIYGCEFIENTPLPGFDRQGAFRDVQLFEISQIAAMVDNTIKTRFIFEINKGTNKHPSINVNANIPQENRRIPIKNMIYVADGPSDIPVFAVIKNHGGKAYAVYNPEVPEEFEQNDMLLQSGRIHAYGPADYSTNSSTGTWLKMHLQRICDRIVADRQKALEESVTKPPRHIPDKNTSEVDLAKHVQQPSLI